MVKTELQFSEDWFIPETRNGFFVDQERKEVWAIELDMLYQVQKICTKYNIPYYADGGTLLGAVRHGGFIPWDDDIDIMMMRKDYDRFVKLAAQELKFPYFVQTNETDNVAYSCCKIRRTDTSAIINNFTAPYTFNKGIWIDIFPMDYMTPELLNKCRCCKRELNAVYRTYNKCDKFSSKYLQLQSLKKALYKMCTSLTDSTMVANISNSLSTQDVTKQVKDLESTLYFKFERLMIPVPIGYHRILTTLYGNWHTPLQLGSLHRNVIFDTNRSFAYVEPDIEVTHPHPSYDYEDQYDS